MAVDIKLALARFDQADSFETEQRKRERDDLAFYEGDGQWPDEYKTLRKGQTAVSASGISAGIPAVPARPCLTINETKEPVRHVINEFEQADLGLSIIPADDFEGEPITPEEIELREGLTRRIQRKTNAMGARVWAASRATIAGRGFWGLMTRDVPGPTLDQEIYYRRFYNQFAVLLDPAHEEPDGSDADWAFVGTQVPWNIYKAEYGEDVDGKANPVINLDDNAWRALNDDAPGWFTLDGETRSVRVVEYWYYDREIVEYAQLEDGSIVDAKKLSKEALKDIPREKRKREVVKTVKFAKIDGKSTFEELDWIGPDIPIIKVVGEEIHPFDKERRCEGMVRPMRDPGQGKNFMVSAAVEAIGLAPKAPVVAYRGQFEGVEQQWDLANTRTIGRLEVNATTDDTGQQLLPLPQRQTAEPPIQAMAMMMAQFDQAIRATSGVPDPSLGNVAPNIRSGRAIRTMIDEAARGNSNYKANFVRSVQREGVILNNLLYPVYGNRPGRRVSLQVSPKETRTVILGQQFVQPTTTSAPVPFDPQQHAGQTPKFYQLTENGGMEVAIKVSKQYDTKREQEAEQLGELIGNNPEMMAWFGDLWFMSQDGPQHRQMAERAKVMLAPPIQKLLQGGQPDDPRIGQMQQAIQELQELADKNKTQLAIAQLRETGETQRAAASDQVQLEKTEITATASMANAQAKVDAENFRSYVDALETKLGHLLNLHLAKTEQIHEAVQNVLQQHHEAARAAQDHAHALAETAHEAALMPQTPENNGNAAAI